MVNNLKLCCILALLDPNTLQNAMLDLVLSILGSECKFIPCMGVILIQEVNGAMLHFQLLPFVNVLLSLLSSFHSKSSFATSIFLAV